MTPEERLLEGEQSLELRRFDAALAAADELIATAPNADAYILRARTCHQLDRPAEAHKAIEDALGMFPDDLRLRAHEAMSLYRLRRADEAIDAADRVLAVNPGDEWAAKAKVGTLRFLRNDYPAARKAVEAALEHSADSALLHAEYAAILFSEAEERQALVHADRAWPQTRFPSWPCRQRQPSSFATGRPTTPPNFSSLH